MTEISPELTLGRRANLPADLRYMFDRYPRDEWQTHANLGGMAQFWLPEITPDPTKNPPLFFWNGSRAERPAA